LCPSALGAPRRDRTSRIGEARAPASFFPPFFSGTTHASLVSTRLSLPGALFPREGVVKEVLFPQRFFPLPRAGTFPLMLLGPFAPMIMVPPFCKTFSSFFVRRALLRFFPGDTGDQFPFGGERSPPFVDFFSLLFLSWSLMRFPPPEGGRSDVTFCPYGKRGPYEFRWVRPRIPSVLVCFFDRFTLIISLSDDTVALFFAGGTGGSSPRRLSSPSATAPPIFALFFFSSLIYLSPFSFMRDGRDIL